MSVEWICRANPGGAGEGDEDGDEDEDDVVVFVPVVVVVVLVVGVVVLDEELLVPIAGALVAVLVDVLLGTSLKLLPGTLVVALVMAPSVLLVADVLDAMVTPDEMASDVLDGVEVVLVARARLFVIMVVDGVPV